MRDHRLYLEDILAAMQSIESFATGMDESTFQTDDKTASAVVRNRRSSVKRPSGSLMK